MVDVDLPDLVLHIHSGDAGIGQLRLNAGANDFKVGLCFVVLIMVQDQVPACEAGQTNAS